MYCTPGQLILAEELLGHRYTAKVYPHFTKLTNDRFEILVTASSSVVIDKLGSKTTDNVECVYGSLEIAHRALLGDAKKLTGAPPVPVTLSIPVPITLSVPVSMAPSPVPITLSIPVTIPVSIPVSIPLPIIKSIIPFLRSKSSNL